MEAVEGGGAERLVGKGDMLYKPGVGALQRLHGAYVDQAEVEQGADYWRGQQKPDYQVDFSSLDQDEANAREDQAASGDDPLYPEVIKFVLERENISIGLLQRRFTIGFNRAARIVEQLEKDGLVGQAQGSKPRNVIRAF